MYIYIYMLTQPSTVVESHVHSSSVQMFVGVDWQTTGTSTPHENMSPRVRAGAAGAGARSLLFGSFWAPCGAHFWAKNDEKIPIFWPVMSWQHETWWNQGFLGNHVNEEVFIGTAPTWPKVREPGRSTSPLRLRARKAQPKEAWRFVSVDEDGTIYGNIWYRWILSYGEPVSCRLELVGTSWNRNRMGFPTNNWDRTVANTRKRTKLFEEAVPTPTQDLEVMKGFSVLVDFQMSGAGC